MGYNSNFIDGWNIPLPTLSERTQTTAYQGSFIHHLRYSILFNIERGFAHATAHNIDGEHILDAQVTSRRFRFDPLIDPISLQTGNEQGYLNNDWDRGHLVRRKSMSWGSEEQAAISERESDFYSNITPQHKNLHSDSWGKIEDWMLKRVQGSQQRACVFQGPVFTLDDPLHQNHEDFEPVRIPAGYWKIVAIELHGIMRCAGFLVWQRDYDDSKPLSFSPVLEQVRLSTIEVLTGISFPALRKFDPLLYGMDGRHKLKRPRSERLTSLRNNLESIAGSDELEFSKLVEKELNKSRSTAIMESEDIIL